MRKLRDNCTYDELWNIAFAYGEALETQPRLLSPIGPISQESKLPYSKKTIKHALATLLLIEQDNDAIMILGSTYTCLHDFVNDDIYNFMSTKLSIKSKEITPSKEEIDSLGQALINLPEAEFRLYSDTLNEKNSEYKRLCHELKFLLEIIGDPNDFAKVLE